MLSPLEKTAVASAIDTGIQKKTHVSGTTTLIIPNEEMNGIMKLVQVLEVSNILLKVITKTIEKLNSRTKRRIFRNDIRY